MKKYNEFCSHLEVLKKAPNEDLTNEFIISGIIDKFYIQFELGWKVLKELLAYEGNSMSATGSPRAILKTAHTYFNFVDEEIWLEMLRQRNDTTHIYNKESAEALVNNILNQYIGEFVKMSESIKNIYGNILDSII